MIEPEKYQEGANFLHDIQGPPTNDVKSLINYYYALQVTDEVYQYTANALYYMTEKQKIQKLLNQLEDNSPTLLTYFFGEGGGHAIVAYGVEYGSFVKNKKSYNVKVITYDNNAVDFSDNYCMYINTSNNSWVIPAYSADTATGSTLGLTTDDLSIMNYHGYFGGNNEKSIQEYISILSSKAIASDFSLRKINMNSNGSYTINAGSEDDIKMFSSFMDDSVQSDIKFAIGDSSKGCMMNLDKTEDIDMSMRYEHDLISVNFENADKVIFDPSGYIEASGENSSYTVDMVSNDGYAPTDWYDLSVSGTGKNVNLKKTKDGYILHSDNFKNITVSAESDNANPKCSFSTDYNDVFIYETDENTIGIAVDTDDNGTYETKIQTSEAVKYGDANEDGKVSISDAVAILQYLANAEKFPLSEQGKLNADVDGVAGVTGKDAAVIQMYDAGVVSALPITTN